jgi:hypothetical protein
VCGPGSGQAETEARPPSPEERQRIAERRAALEFLDADDRPMTTATRDVTAQWITTEQFTWRSNGCSTASPHLPDGSGPDAGTRVQLLGRPRNLEPWRGGLYSLPAAASFSSQPLAAEIPRALLTALTEPG